MKMRVSAFTSGVNAPASRYRVQQLIPYLGKSGIRVYEHPSPVEKYGQTPSRYYTAAFYLKNNPRKMYVQYKNLLRFPAYLRSFFSHAIWLERILVPNYLTYELKFKKPLVFDLDDAIWMNDSEGYGFLDKVVSRADLIFAGNSYLANWCSQYNKNVKIIPTSVDTSKFVPAAESHGDRVVIGWVGTSSNFPYLSLTFGTIKKLLDRYPRLWFYVSSNKSPEFEHERFRFTSWTPEGEVSFLQSLDIGIMPLADDLWTRGKCSFKMLQYLAVGIPAVVSPHGMNAEVLANWAEPFGAANETQWMEMLTALIEDEKLRKSAGAAGRKMIQENYSSITIAGQVASHFKSLT